MCTPPQQGPCVPGGPVLSLPLPLAPGRAVGNLLRPRCDPRVTGPSLTGWDGPSCTEDVSVSRGQCAVLSCSISNPLLNVTIHLKTPGKDFQPLFSVTPPGCFRQGGWQLQVRGGMAQLVIPEVSDTQAGWYRWHLQGLQRNVKNTTLNVSGTEAPDLNQAGNTSSACSCGKCFNLRPGSPGSPSGPRGCPHTLCLAPMPACCPRGWCPLRVHSSPGSKRRPAPPTGLQRACSSGAAGQFQLVLVIVTVMLILLATTLLAWHQRHSPLYSKPPQV
uniref:Uncharacterized protein n=1 Tax=Suricata suricatta TaxID=37032 RepID=A0A673VAZ0_SURSU